MSYKKTYPLLLLLLLSLILKAQDERDFIDYKCIEPTEDRVVFRRSYWQYINNQNSVCRIIDTNPDRNLPIQTFKPTKCTGILVNNTRQDGQLYVLTAAHCLPTVAGTNNNGNLIEVGITNVTQINNRLQHYTFDFFYNHINCEFVPPNDPRNSNPTPPISQEEYLTLTGAELVQFYYSSNIESDVQTEPRGPVLYGNSYEELLIKGVDLALLKITETPSLNSYLATQLYFSGWDASEEGGVFINGELVSFKNFVFTDNDDEDEDEDDDDDDDDERLEAIFGQRSYNNFNGGIAIGHPNGFPGKILSPNYFIPHTYYGNLGDRKIATLQILTNSNIMPGYISQISGGFSGSGIINNANKVFSIISAEMSNLGNGIVTPLNAVWNNSWTNQWANLPNGGTIQARQQPLSHYLDPPDPNNPNWQPTVTLDGGYFCNQDVQVIPAQQQRALSRNITITEDITNGQSGTIVATNTIEGENAILEQGTDIEMIAGDYTEFKTGFTVEKGSRLLVKTAEQNGMGLGCVAGCYSIDIPNNSPYFYADQAYFAEDVMNAEAVNVEITLENGTKIILPEQSISGPIVKLFELLDLQQDASIKGTTLTVDAIFTNNCDHVEKTYTIPISNSLPDNAFLSDYYYYSLDLDYGHKMLHHWEYVGKKNELAAYYQTISPDIGGNPYQATYAEEVAFEVEIETDIIFVQASGYEWNFRGGEGYREINGALTPGNGESLIHHRQNFGGYDWWDNADLKMDVYYPKLKTGVDINNAPSLPVVCYVFGGGYITHDQPELGDEICKWFASKGYIVAFIDYRIGADLTNAQISKRAPIRAWQDVRAAVQFLRMQGEAGLSFGGICKVDPNKIYGCGWSAGAIASLHNLTLSQTTYETERLDGGFLEYTKGNKPYKSLTVDYTTYDLEAYPTTPCKPGETRCTGSTVDAQFNAVGVFAGAIGKPSWLSHLQRPAVDIHHRYDDIVRYGAGKPFKYVTPATNFLQLTEVPGIYGGGYLKASYPDKSEFDVIPLQESWQAGGKTKYFIGGSLGRHHSAMVKWGDKVGKNHPPRLEPKLMFFLDGFFMKVASESETTSTARQTEEKQTLSINKTNTSQGFKPYIYPNPTKENHINLVVQIPNAVKVQFRFIDFTGRNLSSSSQQLSTGFNNIPLNVSKLPNGVFILQVTGADINFSKKVIINRKS